MKSATVRLTLQPLPEQAQRLRALQATFAMACNALAPLVQDTRCWNRVALHHMAYKQLREQFPGLGSQMVCNAVYSVSRMSRLVYQHPKSPFNVALFADRQLPLLHFAPHSPVYFDRHTLSLKDGIVSLFTLDGRMRFQLSLQPAHDRRIREGKLREIVLSSQGEQFMLSFHLAADDALPATRETASEWPEYLLVTAEGVSTPRPLPTWARATPDSLPRPAVRAPVRRPTADIGVGPAAPVTSDTSS